MAKNIEINIQDSSGLYEVLYPKIDLTNNQGTSLPLSSTSGNLASSRVSAGIFSGAFTFDSAVNGKTPIANNHLTTKKYVDDLITNNSGSIVVESKNIRPISIVSSLNVSFSSISSGKKIRAIFVTHEGYITDNEGSGQCMFSFGPAIFDGLTGYNTGSTAYMSCSYYPRNGSISVNNQGVKVVINSTGITVSSNSIGFWQALTCPVNYHYCAIFTD